jgi:hypothetical protein
MHSWCISMGIFTMLWGHFLVHSTSVALFDAAEVRTTEPLYLLHFQLPAAPSLSAPKWSVKGIYDIYGIYTEIAV